MLRQLTVLVVTLLGLTGAAMTNNLHEQVLHTQVRVKTDTAGGSGTVIYSAKSGDYYSTYVITCHHVIEDAIKIETQWDPLLQRDRKAELRQPVLIEFFDWKAVPHGRAPLTSGVRADIVAYNSQHDIALLHTRLSGKSATAQMLPSGKVESVIVGSRVVAAGCALLHDPVLTEGIITHQGDVIDYMDYWMSSALIIYGNSGGGLFALQDGEYYLIGIPSRVAVIGWSSPVTHLGYCSPVTRIYRFFQEQLFDFLAPGSVKTEAQCEAERKTKKELEDSKAR